MTKKIVLTGVTKGIGRALLQEFHEAGCIVAGCGRSKDEIITLQSLYPNCHFKSLDTADSKAVNAWADEVTSDMGIPDLVFNNASIINQPAPLWSIPAEEFAQLININIIGFWNVIQAFVPKMLPQHKGTIINMSSGWGKSGGANFGPYCASKFAVEGMTQSLSKELPQDMITIALSPGIVHTQMLEVALADHANEAPSPIQWAKRAVPFALGLTSKDNGKSLEIHG